MTGKPRLAANPPNGMLNYRYAVLEAEARLSLAPMGLDPGIGFLHADEEARDSLACDVMEPIRPQVDRFVLDWISSKPLKREWFFEQRDGNCSDGFAYRTTCGNRSTVASCAGTTSGMARWCPLVVLTEIGEKT